MGIPFSGLFRLIYAPKQEDAVATIVNSLFHTPRLNQNGRDRVSDIEGLFDTFYRNLERVVGDARSSREFGIMTQKLEQACFYAKRSVCHASDSQER